MPRGRRDLRDPAAHRAGADDADNQILLEQATHHLPWKTGLRFSRNARTPSV